eukprot:534931-Rhodomonas_salina.1
MLAASSGKLPTTTTSSSTRKSLGLNDKGVAWSAKVALATRTNLPAVDTAFWDRKTVEYQSGYLAYPASGTWVPLNGLRVPAEESHDLVSVPGYVKQAKNAALLAKQMQSASTRKLLSKTPQRNQCIATCNVSSKETENSKQIGCERKPAAKTWAHVLCWKS